MRAILLLTLAFFLLPFTFYGQIHIELKKVNVDSLQSVLTELEGTEKINALNKISFSLFVIDPDSSIAIANNAISLSEMLDYQKGKADGFFNLGNSYYILDEFQPTINNYLKAHRIYEDLPPSEESGIVCLQLADLNFFTGRYKESFPYYRKALNIYEKLDHPEGKNRVAGLIGFTKWYLGDYDSAYYYQDLGLSYISHDGNQNKVASHHIQLANINRSQFLDTGDTLFQNKTFQWLYKAKDLHGLDKYYTTFIIYNLGSYSFDYQEKERNLIGVEFFKRVILLADSHKEVCFLVPMVYRRLGEFMYEKGDLDSAAILLNKALELTKRELSCFSMKDYKNPTRANESRWFLKRYKSLTYENLYLVYLKQGDYKQALEYYILWQDAQEERYFEKNKNLISLLEADTENEKTGKQIAMLERDNQINELKVEQSIYFNIGVAALFVILILVGFLFLRQNKLKNEHKSTLLEQKLLRLQMNPHFIFNAFSNILKFIDNNENRKASNYLTTFSKLLRTTLESTREDLVPFEKEVGTLRNYLELQKLRYPDKFEYSIVVDDKIDEEEMSIPPMLVQPFIENAIEHGIRHKKERGKIDVRFILKGKKIQCEVEDDGVGREKAWEAEYTERPGHKSLATEIIMDRIKLLNKKFRQKIRLEIIDKRSDDLEALGTKVLIDLPYGNVY